MWTQFACAALTGLLANSSTDETSLDRICESACGCADDMMETWCAVMDGALEFDEEDAAK